MSKVAVGSSIRLGVGVGVLALAENGEVEEIIDDTILDPILPDLDPEPDDGGVGPLDPFLP